MAEVKDPKEIMAEDETRDETAELTEATEAPETVAADESIKPTKPTKSTKSTEPAEPTEADESQDDAEADANTKLTKAGRHSAKATREAEAEEARQAAKSERAEKEAAEAEAPKPPRRQQPNPLHLHGKKYRAALELVDRTKQYSLDEALELAVKTAVTKFDSSVELHVNLGVDPRQADQMVRSSVVLPHGTGKKVRVAVFADGKLAEDAKAAGADIAATDDLLTAIQAGKLNFDLLIAQPAAMATLGKVAKILGPRGLMPNPKSGTVTPDVVRAVTEAKAGKVEFRIDKQGIVHQTIGKVSFKPDALRENAVTLLSAVLKAKPAAAKGTYVKAVTVSTSMGPGIKLDTAATTAAISGRK